MLYVHGIGAVVFEVEASPDARTQEGTRDLHPESGQRGWTLSSTRTLVRRVRICGSRIVWVEGGHSFVEPLVSRSQFDHFEPGQGHACECVADLVERVAHDIESEAKFPIFQSQRVMPRLDQSIRLVSN